jgi:hypothetical protein
MRQYVCLLFDLAHRQGVGLIYRYTALGGQRLSTESNATINF